MKCNKVKYFTQDAARPELKRLNKKSRSEVGVKAVFTYWCDECRGFHNGNDLGRANLIELNRVALAQELEATRKERRLARLARRPCRHVSYESRDEATASIPTLKKHRPRMVIRCKRCKKHRIIAVRPEQQPTITP